MYFGRCLILGCLVLGAVRASVADEARVAVTADAERFEASLLAVENEQVVFQSDDGTRRLATDDLVRWSHPVAPRSRPQVLLSDYSLLIVTEDWSGRVSLQLGDESLTVLTNSFGSLEIPRQRIVAVILIPPHDLNRREQLARSLRQYDGRTDELWLVGGDRLQGTIQSFDGRQWVVVAETGQITLPAANVEAVAFNSQLLVPPSAADMNVAVGLRDGSLIYASSLHSVDDRLQITTTAGEELAAAPLQDIVSLQALSSTRFTYLSRLEPADYRQVPYLDLQWPWRADGNLVGGRLKSGGKLYLKGIAMHSAARLAYALDGTYRRFVADIALDDAAGKSGSVVFRVFVGREGKWQEALTSDVVRGGDPPRPIAVDIADAQAITLLVDYADRGDELDHANWLDARLVK